MGARWGRGRHLARDPRPGLLLLLRLRLLLLKLRLRLRLQLRLRLRLRLRLLLRLVARGRGEPLARRCSGAALPPPRHRCRGPRPPSPGDRLRFRAVSCNAAPPIGAGADEGAGRGLGMRSIPPFSSMGCDARGARGSAAAAAAVIACLPFIPTQCCPPHSPCRPGARCSNPACAAGSVQGVASGMGG